MACTAAVTHAALHTSHVLGWCRLAAEAVAGEDRMALQLRQAQQMAAAVARKKEEAAAKLDRLTEKKVLHGPTCCQTDDQRKLMKWQLDTSERSCTEPHM